MPFFFFQKEKEKKKEEKKRERESEKPSKQLAVEKVRTVYFFQLFKNYGIYMHKDLKKTKKLCVCLCVYIYIHVCVCMISNPDNPHE